MLAVPLPGLQICREKVLDYASCSCIYARVTSCVRKHSSRSASSRLHNSSTTHGSSATNGSEGTTTASNTAGDDQADTHEATSTDTHANDEGTSHATTGLEHRP